MNNTLVTVLSDLGWVGAAGTVAAYALVSSRRMDANSLRFQVINVVGAGLLALSAMSHSNWSSAASNVLWLSFGALALHRARRSVEQAVITKVRDLRGKVLRPDFTRRQAEVFEEQHAA